MNAIAITPGTATVRLVERPEPTISAPDEIKVRILEVGICDHHCKSFRLTPDQLELTFDEAALEQDADSAATL